MAPLRKAAPRLHGRSAHSEEDSPTQQYGRSSSNLAAEAAALALRNPERSNTTSRGPRRDQKRSSDRRSSRPAPPPHRNSSSFVPAISSPLNPSSPTVSLKSSQSTSSSEDTQSSDSRSSPLAMPSALPRSQSTNALDTVLSSNPSAPFTPNPKRGHRLNFDAPQPLREQHSDPALRDQTPITIHDLGRDYSRYPVSGSRFSYHGASSDPPPPPPLISHTPGSSPGTPNNGTRSPSSDPSNPFITPSTRSLEGNGSGDPEKTFSPVFLDDSICAPTPYSAGLKFPMFIDEKEWDDDMHMPKDDDDITFKPHLSDYAHRQGLMALFSLFVLVLTLVVLFVIVPVLTFTGHANVASSGPVNKTNPADFVTDQTFPSFKNIRSGLIDPDTPDSAMTRTSVNGEKLNLVWSDEFNQEGRTFYPEDDPYWTAPDFWYGATQDLEWYDPDAASTANGTLNLQLDKFLNHNLNYRSGMLNSWNQICFKGGALEVALSLPGPAGSPGLWPGAWTMGNLGRPGYGATTEGVWPYTYSSCDAGITPNQSTPDGTSFQPGQKLAACTCSGADHPTPGTGRGAPEIDVIEASVDPTNLIGVVTQSYQMAPYDVWYHPDYKFLAIPNELTTQMNSYCGGPYQQAISGTTLLNNNWYDGKEYQKYAFEYTPGTTEGEIAWFVGEDVAYQLNGRALGPNGNVDAREVSQEPMSMVLNLGLSNSWTFINWANRTFPTTMSVDYVRWYQKEGEESVTCDPPGYETTEYIAKHPEAYNNQNLTHWHQTGYEWPKQNLDGRC